MKTKFKVGDRIHVEFTITDTCDTFLSISRIQKFGIPIQDSIACISPAIVKHIPKPPEPIKVGDFVRFKYDPNRNLQRGEVLAIFEDRAWVKFPASSIPLAPPLTEIRKLTE